MEMISTGIFKSGTILPPESELCRSFNVGRSTLREGLKALSILGIVRMRSGKRTVVTDGSPHFLDQAYGQGLLRGTKDVKDLFESRMLLDPKIAALCARNATEEDLLRLDECMAEMRTVRRADPARLAQLDLQFHLAIAEGSKNRILARLYRTLQHLVHELVLRSGRSPGTREKALAYHEEILAALKRRDSRSAGRAMRRHLAGNPWYRAIGFQRRAGEGHGEKE